MYSLQNTIMLGLEPLLDMRPTRQGTPLDYRIKPNRWPNGHTQARQAGRLLTKPGTMQRGWNMLDYYTQAKYGYSAGDTEPYRNR